MDIFSHFCDGVVFDEFGEVGWILVFHEVKGVVVRKKIVVILSLAFNLKE